MFYIFFIFFYILIYKYYKNKKQQVIKMSFTSEKINNIYNTLYKYCIKIDDATDSIVKQIESKSKEISPEISEYLKKKAEYKGLLSSYYNQNYTEILENTTLANYNYDETNIITDIHAAISSNSNIKDFNSDQFNILFNSIPEDKKTTFKNKFKAYNYLLQYYEVLQKKYNEVKGNIKKFLGENLNYKGIQEEYNDTFTLYPKTISFNELKEIIKKNLDLSIDTLGKLLFILTTAYICNNCTFEFKGQEMKVSDLNIVTFYNYDLKYDINIEGESFQRKPLFILKRKSNDDNADNKPTIDYKKIITNKFIPNYKKYVELYNMYTKADADKKTKFIYDIMCVLKVLMEILVDMNNKYVEQYNYDNYKLVLLTYIYNDNTKLKLKTDTINEDFFGLYDLEDDDKRQYEIYYLDTDLVNKAKAKQKTVDEYLEEHFNDIKVKESLIPENANKQYVPPILYAIHYFSDLNSDPINIKTYIESLQEATKEIDTITKGEKPSNNIKPIPLTDANTQEAQQTGFIQQNREIKGLLKSIEENIKQLNITINDENVFNRINQLIDKLYTNWTINQDSVNTVYNNSIEILRTIKDQLELISSTNNNNNQRQSIIEQTGTINNWLEQLKQYLTENIQDDTPKEELNLPTLNQELKDLLKDTPAEFQNSINKSLQDETDESLYENIINNLKIYLSSLNTKSEANYDKFKNIKLPEENPEQKTGGARKSPKQKARNHSRRRLRNILNKKKHSKKLN